MYIFSTNNDIFTSNAGIHHLPENCNPGLNAQLTFMIELTGPNQK